MLYNATEYARRVDAGAHYWYPKHVVLDYSLVDLAKTILGPFHDMYTGDRIDSRYSGYSACRVPTIAKMR